MSKPVILIEKLSKQYRLGTIGAGTIRGDFERWLAKLRGKEDPFLQVGAENRLNNEEGKFVWALKEINLEIKEGEVFGIIGKNGAGKTTLLKILSRVTGPTTGSVKVRGRIASLLEVGTGFHQELTGRENIFLNGAILGMKKPEIRSKLDEIIDFAGIQKYIDTPVKRYSSGMYVRLAFAVAAHLDPEILVVDEVLAVGDAEFQQKAIGKLKNVSDREGRTVLFVSHNMASIESLCGKGILLNNGIIKQEGEIDRIISSYLKQVERSTKVKWNNPNKKSASVHLLSVYISDMNGNLRNTYSNTEPIQIVMELEISKIESYLKIGFEIIMDGWRRLFTAFHNDLIDKKNIKLKIGLNKLRFIIPENLLNKGYYSMNAVSGIHRKHWIYQYENIINFQIDFKIHNHLLAVNQRPENIIAPLISCETLE